MQAGRVQCRLGLDRRPSLQATHTALRQLHDGLRNHSPDLQRIGPRQVQAPHWLVGSFLSSGARKTPKSR
eukprot:3442925-Prymnesium_polylepis.1